MYSENISKNSWRSTMESLQDSGKGAGEIYGCLYSHLGQNYGPLVNR